LPTAVCPHCRTELDLDADDAGRLVECPACEQQFTADPPPPAVEPPWRRAGDPDDTDRPRRRQWPFRDFDESADGLVRYAQDQCNGAGCGLVVVGALTLVAGLGRMILSLSAGNNAGGGPTPLLLGVGVYSVLVGAFWMYAGKQMMAAKQYGLCLVACVMVLIPGVSPCCVIGLFFGISGISRLNDPRVKRGFAANRPGFDPDAGG
jgi:hypothetical protein